MKPRDLLPNLPHEGPPIPRFLTQREEEEQEIAAPGCVCADEVLTVLGHLNGLSEGWGGFGVMRQSKERLERAAKAARQAEAEDIASALLEVVSMLPEVHSSADAERVVQKLKPVAREAWELGKHCKDTREITRKALEALRMIKAGEIS